MLLAKEDENEKNSKRKFKLIKLNTFFVYFLYPILNEFDQSQRGMLWNA